MPGLDGTGISLEPLLDRIPADVDVTVIRYPTDELLSFEDHVECALSQVEDGGDRLVLAESFSGPVAVQLVGSGRIEADCLVLCATFVKPPRPFVSAIAKLLPLEALLRLPLPKLFMNMITGGREFSDAILPLWRRIEKAVPASTLAHRLRLLEGVDVTGYLEGLNIPCCYLQASKDRLVPSRCLAPLAEDVPELEIRRLGGPHFLLQVRPEACLATIDDFVGTINRR